MTTKKFCRNRKAKRRGKDPDKETITKGTVLGTLMNSFGHSFQVVHDGQDTVQFRNLDKNGDVQHNPDMLNDGVLPLTSLPPFMQENVTSMYRKWNETNG